jgi:hypothetical protein
MSKTYNLQTVEDFLKIPVDKVDACLADFAKILKSAPGISRLGDAFAKGIDPDLQINLALNSMTWIDDGVSGVRNIQIESTPASMTWVDESDGEDTSKAKE